MFSTSRLAAFVSATRLRRRQGRHSRATNPWARSGAYSTPRTGPGPCAVDAEAPVEVEGARTAARPPPAARRRRGPGRRRAPSLSAATRGRRARPRRATRDPVANAVAGLELDVAQAEASAGRSRRRRRRSVVYPSTRKASCRNSGRSPSGRCATRCHQSMNPSRAPPPRPWTGHANADVEVRPEAPAHREVESERLAVDQEPAVLGLLARDVLGPGEGVGPQGGHLQRPPARAGRVRRDGGQRQPRLGQQVRVADLGGPAGKVSGRGGAESRRGGEEGEEKGEVFHGWGWGSRRSMHPS